MDDLKHYILFPSYNNGLVLESYLKKAKIKYTIVPTPRELSSCCGISIKYELEDEAAIKKLIEDNSIRYLDFIKYRRTTLILILSKKVHLHLFVLYN